MCGRFVTKTDPAKMAQIFDVDALRDDGEFRENYNVAPTQAVYAVTEEETAPGEGDAEPAVERVLARYRWGLVPHWAKDIKVGYKMINARGETVASRNAFKGPLRRHRCLIPADGFYEWKRDGQERRPYFVHAADGSLLAFAGLWDTWRDKAEPEAEWLRTCTIITTAANARMAAIHDRMPVILPQELWAGWLDPGEHDPDALTALLRPASDDLLDMYEVGREVGSVRNNAPHLIDRVAT
ncbi:MAG: SOS response-associated peptidase [Acidimicrobiia bacterium]|nr:SOS response-associated peptidase [Acidimicrobiia bacterium]